VYPLDTPTCGLRHGGKARSPGPVYSTALPWRSGDEARSTEPGHFILEYRHPWWLMVISGEEERARRKGDDLGHGLRVRSADGLIVGW